MTPADDIISDLYAGTLDELAWRRGVLAITDRVRGASAVLFDIDPSREIVVGAESHGVEAEITERFARDWADKDLRLAPALRRPAAQPMFDRMLLPMRTWKASPIYNEFLLEIDRPWLLTTWLCKGRSKGRLFTIHGSRRRGPLEEQDGKTVLPFMAHLRRALEIRERFSTARIRAETLSSSLDRLSFGVVVLDGKGRLLEANEVAQALLRSDSGIARAPDGSLWLRDPAGAQLRRWLFSGLPPDENREGLLRVSRPATKPLSIAVTRLPTTAPSCVGGSSRWMLLIFDPDRRVTGRVDTIARDLGISQREAEVASLVVSGYTLREVAQRLQITLNTARTHIKSIFAKTGCRSQIALATRITRGPATILSDFET
jgi:DNA-binding CsgD family transcriptional regulator